MIITTIIDKRIFEFEPKIDGWIPHQYEETKQYDTFYGWVNNWTVVDVGAWIGLWSIWASPNVKKVYAIEPLAYDKLNKNISLNNFNNIEVIPFAMGAYDGKACMDITATPSLSTLIINMWNHGAEYLYTGNKKEINIMTWDSFVENNKIKEINLMKIDAEGSELDVFLRMTKILPERICVAVYHIPSPLNLIYNILHEKGYVLEGFGYYDKNAKNKGEPHSAFFRRKDIEYNTPMHYQINEYERPVDSVNIPFLPEL